ncbi:hypothetical protein [Enterococcus nangangensis]|uniref:hypothetical protein n=1 Tax=Enterococcus nangangensis TaxID=2559926 RepID=UPI0010F790DA|nr:hypothetical protein [Enterococcus nangangensis]
MQKLITICRREGFNQRTFYQWLQDEELIVKSEMGYEIGPRALTGMETFHYNYRGADGSQQERTQVRVPQELVAPLADAFQNSGLERLYSPTNVNPNALDSLELLKRQTAKIEGLLLSLQQHLKEVHQLLEK